MSWLGGSCGPQAKMDYDTSCFLSARNPLGELMVDSFWSGGANAHERVARAEHKAKLSQLHAALAECTDESQRQGVKQQISLCKAQLRKEFDGIDRLLF